MPSTMLFRYNTFALAALYILLVKGQEPPITVSVGLQGSFYSPETISAAENTTVVFQFFGDVHTVTQSSFEDPCSPLPGGFHSGFAGLGLNASAPVPVWNLVVTNASLPIWYFCAVTSPKFHCTVGMVGAINPPGQPKFSQFTSAAKLVTTTPVIDPTPVLTGRGASASAAPSPNSFSVMSTLLPATSSTLATSTSTSTTSTPSPTHIAVHSTTSRLGRIVGGAVGGAVGLIGLIGLIAILWFFCLRTKKNPDTFQSDDLFRYNPIPVRRPGEPFLEAQRTENLYHNTPVTSNTDSFIPSARLSPLRYPSGPVILQPPHLRRSESVQSDLASSSSNPTSPGPNVPERPSNVDIHALAQEVAAVLYDEDKNSSQDLRGQKQPELAVQNHSDIGSSQSTDQPPNYRTVMGPSTDFTGKDYHT